ncbi:MAG: DNA internalization-related competence protein ComEC/Rec2 [Actinomycetota bacterium]
MSSWVLPAAAAAVWAGIAARSPLPFSPAIHLLAGLALLVGTAVVSPGRSLGRDPLGAAGLAPAPDPRIKAVSVPRLRVAGVPSWVRAGMLLAACALIGGGWSGVRAEALERSYLVGLGHSNVRIEGSLRSDPSPGPFGWTALASVTTVESSGKHVSLREAAWIEGAGRPPDARRTDRIELFGSLDPIEPGGFGDYLRSRGVAVVLRIDRFERVGSAANPLVLLAAGARDLLGRSIANLFAPREAGLLMGLALGDTSGLDPSIERDFRATGLGHHLAVSGENVAMILGPILGLALLLRLRPAARFGLGAASIVFFVVMTGGEPSVLRAGLMAVLTILGVLLGRPRNAASILGATVLLLLLLDPFLADSIGFRLSVAATTGIVSLAPPLSTKLSFLPKALAITVATTLGAQAGVTPVLLYHFHWVPGVTLLANVLAFPAVAPALLIGLAAAGCALVLPPLGWIFAKLAWIPMRYLQVLADRLATAPVPSITSGGGWLPLILGPVVLVGIARWVRGHRPPRVVVVSLGLLLPVFVWGTALRAGPPAGLAVRFFDVGQGDGALVTSPGGANILIDGGPDEELVATKLASLGVRRLDAVVATHAHADHIDGLIEVFARFPVGVVLEPGCDEPSPNYREFEQALEQEGLPVRHPRAGQILSVGDLRLEVLSPEACFEGTASDPNNDSLVIRLSHLEDTVLFTGDAEEPAQEEMLADGAPLAAPVLKVPHHGGGTSLEEFLDATDAEVAVVSVGENDYGHPVAEVLEMLEESGARVLRTDRLGDVTIRFEDVGLLVESAAA